MKIKIICWRCGCNFDVLSSLGTHNDPFGGDKFYECPNCKNKVTIGQCAAGGSMSRNIKQIIEQIVERWVEDNEFTDQHSSGDDRSFIVFEETKKDLIEKLTKAFTPGEGISGY